MECITINGTNLESSRIGLGSWAMGGWMWGGAEEAESIRTIPAALEKGINLIDTAPVYGFGRSEETVGRAVEQWGNRDKVIIALVLVQADAKLTALPRKVRRLA